MWPLLHMLYSSTAGSSRRTAALLAPADSLQLAVTGIHQHILTLTCGAGAHGSAACAPDLQRRFRGMSCQGSHHDATDAKLLQMCVHLNRRNAVEQHEENTPEVCTLQARAACSKHMPCDAPQERLRSLVHLHNQEAHCMSCMQGSTYAHTQVCNPANSKPAPAQPVAKLQEQWQQRWQAVSRHHLQRSEAYCQLGAVARTPQSPQHLSWIQPHCMYTCHDLWKHRHHAPQYQQQHHYWQQQQQQHYHHHHHHHRHYHQENKPVGSKHPDSTAVPTAGSLHHQVQGTESPRDTQQTRNPGQEAEAVAGSAFTTLPNLLSLSRVAASPLLAYCIAAHHWPLAIALTAAAGASDWLDGHMARRLQHTSKLGSYLDPLADKVFIASAVGTMGYMGMLPGWLAVAVVGRDSVQVVGMFWYRLRMFGGVWPGASAFFNVDREVAPVSTPTSSNSSSSSVAANTASHSDAAAASQPSKMQHGIANTAAGAHQQVAARDLPMIRPLLISKVNTALIMVLVAGCMAHQWQGVPDASTLHSLELVTASTTIASAAAYAHLHWLGQLLVDQPNKRDSAQ